jgi:CRISPR-associated protein Cas1
VPNTPERCYDTQRVQLMAQGLLLREQGYQCDHGMVYFAGSRVRVTVPFTSELELQTRELINKTQAATHLTVIPDPLEDSPKCAGCSIAGICMPDETLALRDIAAMRAAAGNAAIPAKPRGHGEDVDNLGIRRLFPPRPTATPLYVQHQGAYVSKKGESLVVKAEGEELTRVGTKDVSQVVLCGNVQMSTQTVHLLLEADIPVVYFSAGMWFYGAAHGITLKNAYDRAAQFAAAADRERSLTFARGIVQDKAMNQRTQLRRNAATSPEVDRALRDMEDLVPQVEKTASVESLLGLEGNVARSYFSQFSAMLRPRDMEASWDFAARNRRPPKDPVNAMLSFAYALLAKECTVALLAEGLDPFWGFYHRPRHGRPALALDMMEPLPIIADSAVITAINTGMVGTSGFTIAASGCCMNDAARKGLLRAYEARLDQMISHPAFGYRCSWRSAILLQARLLSRWLRGDIDRYSNIVTR